MGTRRRVAMAGLTAVVVALLLSHRVGEAHKPITSPFTFNQDVLPIVRTQCGGCHVEGGVAPMSLMTHEQAVPWGESIRAELLAGHMPPWTVDGPRDRFQNAQALTARELDILLTWVTGGTPAGDPADAAGAVNAASAWPLGAPDLALPLPVEYTLAADAQEATADFTIATGLREPMWVRAVDLLPDAAAIVRSATIRLMDEPVSASAEPGPERILAVWVPGDRPVPLEGEAAFLLPANAELGVSVHYRKTWQHEREAIRDRSTIGIYRAPGPAPELQAVALMPGVSGTGDASARDGSTISFETTIAQHLHALAIYPDPALTDAHVTVIAARPDGSKEELIAFRPAAGWERRYWFAEPVLLPRGTTLTVTARLDDPLRPPGALPPAPPADPSAIRLTLDVVPAVLRGL